MPLVHLDDMLNHAYRHNYAVGAFGVADLHFLEGIMQAAENCRAPVVLNLIESHFAQGNLATLIPAVMSAAERSAVPVAVNFDHGVSKANAERAIRAGCNGIMVDTSMLPFSDNLWQTREIVAMAHACGVTVEGELGYVPGIEGENAKNYPGELSYTSAAEAAGFVERTGVDCLAVSVGTVHGRMKGVPKLDYGRLAKIKEATAIPLVIHGGTGLSDEQYRKLINNGIAKINYYTALAEVAGKRIRENWAQDRKMDYSGMQQGVSDEVRIETERCMRLWGAGGRAAEVLAQCRPWREAQHVLLFNLHEPPSIEESTAIISEVKSSLEEVSGVLDVHVAQSFHASDAYRYSLTIKYVSQQALLACRNHPTALNAYTKLLLSHVTNYEVAEGWLD